MLAKLSDKPFDDKDWLFEIKWDGYRAVAETGDQPRLYSRNGLSFSEDYPEIYEAITAIKHTAVLDGEIVALDEEGKPSFQLLQHYHNTAVPLVYYVFDCLSVNGQSIAHLPLTERKEMLQQLLPKSDHIKYCDHVTAKGKAFFASVVELGLEGVMAKRADSTYASGERTNDWLKVKNLQTEEAVIAGYTQGRGGRKYLGALVLGTYVNGRLTYIGHTGTGFNDKVLKEVYDKLQPLVAPKTPFDAVVPLNAPVTWVKPLLVCNIKFTEVTRDGHRRHPVFLGLRKDKLAAEVSPEVTATPKQAGVSTPDNVAIATQQQEDMQEINTGRKKVQFSNTDKVFWPDEGFTKGDVINYYNLMFPHIIRYLKDRPESLMRTPNGIAEKGFFHKDAGLGAPDWVKTLPLHSESADKDINYIICNDKPTLLYLANLGCIEINPWNSRIKTLDRPDYLVMDIDPSAHNTFEQVIDTALVIKAILDKARAVSFPKTSGATGIHIYVPLNAKYTYDQCREFAHMIAMLTHDELPAYTSLERSLSKRGEHNIYIDYLQNRAGQTLASAYSLRPRPGATVSAPLQWSEVKHGLHPSQFHIGNMAERLTKKGDLFQGVLGKGIDMMKSIKKLGS
jgi:bifunctional non-homologous end joining protein LigD